MGPRYFKAGFSESERRVDDNVDSNNREGRINLSPLEIMLRADLDGRRRSEAKGDDGAVNGMMTKLSLSLINLKGS